MRRAAKRDTTQPEVIAALEAAGYAVLDLADLGHSRPDLLAVCPDTFVSVLLEVKGPRTPVTPEQRAWHEGWRSIGGLVEVVRTGAEAVAVMRRAGEMARNRWGAK